MSDKPLASDGNLSSVESTEARTLLKTDNTSDLHQIIPDPINSSSLHVSTDRWANVPDTILVEFVQSGDHSAYSDFVKRHSTLAFRTAYRITKNKQDAEDAMQDSLFRAFDRINSFDGRSAFATWLTRIAINASLMILRKRRKYASTSLDDQEIDLQITDPAPGSELLLVRLGGGKRRTISLVGLCPPIPPVVLVWRQGLARFQTGFARIKLSCS
jgi:hypothetical protein